VTNLFQAGHRTAALDALLQSTAYKFVQRNNAPIPWSVLLDGSASVPPLNARPHVASMPGSGCLLVDVLRLLSPSNTNRQNRGQPPQSVNGRARLDCAVQVLHAAVTTPARGREPHLALLSLRPDGDDSALRLLVGLCTRPLYVETCVALGGAAAQPVSAFRFLTAVGSVPATTSARPSGMLAEWSDGVQEPFVASDGLMGRARSAGSLPLRTLAELHSRLTAAADGAGGVPCSDLARRLDSLWTQELVRFCNFDFGASSHATIAAGRWESLDVAAQTRLLDAWHQFFLGPAPFGLLEAAEAAEFATAVPVPLDGGVHGGDSGSPFSYSWLVWNLVSLLSLESCDCEESNYRVLCCRGVSSAAITAKSLALWRRRATAVPLPPLPSVIADDSDLFSACVFPWFASSDHSAKASVSCVEELVLAFSHAADIAVPAQPGLLGGGVSGSTVARLLVVCIEALKAARSSGLAMPFLAELNTSDVVQRLCRCVCARVIQSDTAVELLRDLVFHVTASAQTDWVHATLSALASSGAGDVSTESVSDRHEFLLQCLNEVFLDDAADCSWRVWRREAVLERRTSRGPAPASFTAGGSGGGGDATDRTAVLYRAVAAVGAHPGFALVLERLLRDDVDGVVDSRSLLLQLFDFMAAKVSTPRAATTAASSSEAVPPSPKTPSPLFRRASTLLRSEASLSVQSRQLTKSVIRLFVLYAAEHLREFVDCFVVGFRPEVLTDIVVNAATSDLFPGDFKELLLLLLRVASEWGSGSLVGLGAANVASDLLRTTIRLVVNELRNPSGTVAMQSQERLVAVRDLLLTYSSSSSCGGLLRDSLCEAVDCIIPLLASEFCAAACDLLPHLLPQLQVGKRDRHAQLFAGCCV
jgi:hypothetical protein